MTTTSTIINMIMTNTIMVVQDLVIREDMDTSMVGSMLISMAIKLGYVLYRFPLPECCSFQLFNLSLPSLEEVPVFLLMHCTMRGMCSRRWHSGLPLWSRAEQP